MKQTLDNPFLMFMDVSPYLMSYHIDFVEAHAEESES